MIHHLLRPVLLCCLTLAALPAHARVDVETQGGLLAAKISEEITPGDYERLLQGLRANPGAYSRKIVLLDSIGGSAPEAIRIGRLLRETGFEALVPTGGVCQGSCVYLLAAGKRKIVKGHVALRRPPFPAGDSAQAQRAHGRQPFSPASYLREMGVDIRLAEDIYQAAPGSLKLLSEEDLRRYRLN